MSEHKSDKLEPAQILTDLQQKSQKVMLSSPNRHKGNSEAAQKIKKKNTGLDAIPQGGSDMLQQNSASKGDVLEIGDIINNRFILVKELGRGGMGVVYKAKDLRKEEARDRNPFIALKVLSDDFKKNPDSFIALQRETRKTQELAHPNIVTVYDFDKDGEHVYMTMECLDGKPLSILLHEQYFQSSPIQERWSIIQQISLALAYAHKKNIIHLDLKPGNIYVKKDGTVKVLDFGIARAAKNVDDTETSQDTTVFDAGSLGALTPPYASCEMLENQAPDFRDDIYALACVAYEILANQHPFNKIPATQARFNNMKPSPIKEITRKQRKALMHGLVFNREDRVPTIDQFLQEVQLSDSGNAGGVISLPWKWTRFVFSVVLIGLIWQVYSIYNTGTEAPGLIEKPVFKAPVNSILTENEKKKISRMLEIAEMHLMIGRLVEPKGTNALAAYNEVLLIDPPNQAALKGIDEIASYYEQQARELWNKGEKEKSIGMLNKGLQASNKNKDLIKLQQMIRSEGY